MFLMELSGPAEQVAPVSSIPSAGEVLLLLGVVTERCAKVDLVHELQHVHQDDHPRSPRRSTHGRSRHIPWHRH